jgi:hypothetical protein
MVRHQAALASGKLTRVTSGVNLPPSEVIMSRRLKINRPSFLAFVRDPIAQVRSINRIGGLYDTIVSVHYRMWSFAHC